MFASSRDALRRALVGVALEIQGTDYDEVAYASGTYPIHPSLSLLDPTLIAFAGQCLRRPSALTELPPSSFSHR